MSHSRRPGIVCWAWVLGAHLSCAAAAPAPARRCLEIAAESSACQDTIGTAAAPSLAASSSCSAPAASSIAAVYALDTKPLQ